MKHGTTRREQALSRKRKEWERRIREWRTSGLSQAEYQRQHNIPQWQFVYWKKQFEQVLSDEVTLVPIPLPERNGSGTPLFLAVNDRYRIEIHTGFDPEVLEQVLRVVERA